jgi:signal transduction histidine kinase
MNEFPNSLPHNQKPETLRDRWRALLRYQGVELIRLTTYVIIFIMLLLFILENRADLARWRFYGTIASLAVILVINLTWDRLTARLFNEDTGNLLLVLTSSALMLLTAWLGHYITIIYLFFMIAAQAFIIFNFGRALRLVSAIFIAYLLEMWLLGIELEGMLSLGSGLVVGLVFIATLSRVLTGYAEQTRRAERLAAELRQANADLLAARQREAELAVAEERVRLARDIHDGLGHHLTVLNIQLQAISKLTHRDPQQAEAMLAASREEARAALDEVRRSVAFMRQTPLDGKNLRTSLENLVDLFNCSSTGLRASLEFEGVDADLDAATATTLYRVAQEGLTNAQKHAVGASLASIRIGFGDRSAVISVSDDGQTPTLESSGALAFGLSGLRERIEQLGGRFEAGPLEGGGFRLQAEIPLMEKSHD